MSNEYHPSENPTQPEEPVGAAGQDAPTMQPEAIDWESGAEFLGGVVRFTSEVDNWRPNERRIASLAILGASKAEIGTHLRLSDAAVNYGLELIYKEMGTSARSGLLHAMLTHEPPFAYVSRRAEARNGYTAQQRPTLECVARGLTNSDIADQLKEPIDTIKTRVRTMIKRNDLKNRIQLSSHGILLGLVDVPAEVLQIEPMPESAPRPAEPPAPPKKRTLLPPPPPASLVAPYPAQAGQTATAATPPVKQSRPAEQSIDPNDPRLRDFTDTISSILPMLGRYLHRRVGDAMLVEDFTQETIVRALRHFDQFMSIPPQERKPWLCRVAANIVNDHFKSHRFRCEKNYDDDAHLSHIVSGAASENAYEEVEDLINLQQILAPFWDDVPPKYRQLLLYRFYYDLPLAEIAKLTGHPTTSALKTALGRAKQYAQRLAQQSGYDAEALSHA